MQSWKPNLVIRKSIEFATVIAAAEANIPIVRVATTNAKLKARMLLGDVRPVDVLATTYWRHAMTVSAMAQGESLNIHC